MRANLHNSPLSENWRSLEELAGTREFQQSLQAEFSTGASEWLDGLSRRNFLKLATASMALAGLTACTRQPTREIFPYVNQPAELVLGEPLFYATSMVLGGFATGALVKSREGHPVKIEGNPDHPASLGGSSVWLQASILDLYNPDRSQSVLRNGDFSSWADFLADLNTLIAEQRPKRGAGLRFLTETVTSPTLATQMSELHKLFPESRWCQFEPISRDNVRLGAEMAFGQSVATQYQFDKAKIILSLESDFLYFHPDRLRYTRHFTDGRRVGSGLKQMNRLYVVESSPTITGSIADNRLPLESSKIEAFTRLLAGRLGLPVQAPPDIGPSVPGPFIDSLVADLQENRGASIVIAGESQPPIVHAMAHLLNQHLGNPGKALFYTEPADVGAPNDLSIQDLAKEMDERKVDALFILGSNPVYSCPCDLGFDQLLGRVPRSIHLGLELDETAALSAWHIPATHYLESWGDARSYDGTVSLIQPLISPLYNGKSAYEVLGAFFQQQPLFSDYEIVRNYWQSQNKWADFEAGWRESLHNGFIANTRSAPQQVNARDFATISRDENAQRAPEAPLVPAAAVGNSSGTNSQATGLEFSASDRAAPAVLKATGLEICFRPDASVWDGRFANNGWLQECPKPFSKLTWDNAALISPGLAQRCRIYSGDVVELAAAGRRLRVPVWVMPGQADKSVTLTLGYGRKRIGRVGAGVGFNAYLMRTARMPWNMSEAQLFSTGTRHEFASTQLHHALDSSERQVFRGMTWEAFQANPNTVKNSVEQPPPGETLYYPDEYPYKGHKWGMSIDLTTCIGCNACLVACETENNIPFVGKDQIQRRRDMFWIRIDTYYRGSIDNPRFAHVPVPCMHCEHAPCELVCPVEATVHDAEGLNLQVYNRCVGTRFCSNNCPYKVRRFNFLQYANYHQPSYKPMYNPEVTVRWRGVMEKCTYCIQRISAARIASEKSNRPIRDGEVVTACQQACPANAIIFGDLNASKSEVAALKRMPHDYSMLGQLNTRPRTTYLAKIENPNRKAGPVS